MTDPTDPTDPRPGEPAPSLALLLCDALLLAALLASSLPDRLMARQLRGQLDALLAQALVVASTPDVLVARRLAQHKARMRATDPDYVG